MIDLFGSFLTDFKEKHTFWFWFITVILIATIVAVIIFGIVIIISIIIKRRSKSKAPSIKGFKEIETSTTQEELKEESKEVIQEPKKELTKEQKEEIGKINSWRIGQEGELERVGQEVNNAKILYNKYSNEHNVALLAFQHPGTIRNPKTKDQYNTLTNDINFLSIKIRKLKDNKSSMVPGEYVIKRNEYIKNKKIMTNAQKNIISDLNSVEEEKYKILDKFNDTKYKPKQNELKAKIKKNNMIIAEHNKKYKLKKFKVFNKDDYIR